MIQKIGVLIHFRARSNHRQPEPYYGVADERKAVPQNETYTKSPNQSDEDSAPGNGVTPEKLPQQAETERIRSADDQDQSRDSNHATHDHTAGNTQSCPMQGSKRPQ